MSILFVVQEFLEVMLKFLEVIILFLEFIILFLEVIILFLEVIILFLEVTILFLEVTRQVVSIELLWQLKPRISEYTQIIESAEAHDPAMIVIYLIA